MSNSLTVHILLRKYANNLYSFFNLALYKIFLDALNRNIFRTKYLFCCIAYANWFTITILLMSFTLLIFIFSTKFFKHLLRRKKSQKKKTNTKTHLNFASEYQGLFPAWKWLPLKYLFSNIPEVPPPPLMGAAVSLSWSWPALSLLGMGEASSSFSQKAPL